MFVTKLVLYVTYCNNRVIIIPSLLYNFYTRFATPVNELSMCILNFLLHKKERVYQASSATRVILYEDEPVMKQGS